MTSRWLISVPVWGDRCLDVFCATALPTLERAIARVSAEAHLVVHTDSPRRIADGVSSLRLEPRPVPAGARDFDSLSEAHREVLRMACLGDVVVLLTADMVVSSGTFEYCRRALDGDTHLVVCCSIRVIQEGRIPDTDNAPALAGWAWEHRHPMTVDSTYPDGRLADLSRLYFDRGGCTVARVALPHPLAVRIDGRPLPFGPTVDATLINSFKEKEIHVVTDMKEVAVADLSPRDKEYKRSERTIAECVEAGEAVYGNKLQAWLARHRIVLQGDPADLIMEGDSLPSVAVDEAVVERIIR